ncbi:MAG: hypothetical protein RBU30_20195 [Polyangia bacterium]|nr:hypothetical protein [Polyangia bacterium]
MVALLVPGLALSTSACDVVTAKRTTEQVIPVKPGTPVHLSTPNGWILVRPGRAGLVTVKAHSRVTALRGAERSLDKLSCRATKNKGVLRIRGHHPADPNQRRYQLAFVLTVPRRTSLVLETDRGFLDVADLEGDVTGRTGDGEIRVSDVSGSLDLVTGAGNIRATGRLTRLHLETRVGELQLTLSPGSRLGADSRALTRRGLLSLALPPDLRATITAEARQGLVESEFPHQSKSPGWLRTLVAGGGPQIQLVSHRGDVRIRAAR